MSLRESAITIESPSSPLRDEGLAIAEEAGLRYVCDNEPGFSRRRAGKGFFYIDYQNNKITSDNVLTRIRSLVIPPAWEGVWICRHANGHLQATGRDDRLRKQYRYHSTWSQVRNETKFAKLSLFGECLPALRSQLEKDISLSGMCREKVLAAVVRTMEETMIRIGNCEYAEENDSYGLTTIRNNHAKVAGSEVMFRFRGKSGVLHETGFSDKRLSKIIRNCQDLPGQELFCYQDEDGTTRDVGSSDVNAYLREISGECITAKDFRTWGATVHAAEYLFNMGPPQGSTQKEKKARQLGAIKAASEYLGNTVAVCRKYYVHPVVFAADENRALIDSFKQAKRKTRGAVGQHLDLSEIAVLDLLKKA